MKIRPLLCVLVLSSWLMARPQKEFQKGKLLQMDSVECDAEEDNPKGIAGEKFAIDPARNRTPQTRCQEYVLESETVIYRIRPKSDRKPVLLPIGREARFRIEKDKMILRVESLDDKDREYNVVSMTPR